MITNCVLKLGRGAVHLGGTGGTTDSGAGSDGAFLGRCLLGGLLDSTLERVSRLLRLRRLLGSCLLGRHYFKSDCASSPSGGKLRSKSAQVGCSWVEGSNARACALGWCYARPSASGGIASGPASCCSAGGSHRRWNVNARKTYSRCCAHATPGICHAGDPCGALFCFIGWCGFVNGGLVKT